MAKKKTSEPVPELVVENLGNGMVRLTAANGVLRHKATRRIHSEAVVPRNHVRMFEAVAAA